LSEEMAKGTHSYTDFTDKYDKAAAKAAKNG
jgi:hypothetical protein